MVSWKTHTPIHDAVDRTVDGILYVFFRILGCLFTIGVIIFVGAQFIQWWGIAAIAIFSLLSGN